MIVEHTLNPYPRKLWIIIDENFDNIKSKFQFVSNEDAKLTNKDLNDKCEAIVMSVSKDEYNGYMVFIINKIDEILVHEALHIALNVYIDCGMEISPEMDQEPLCYLTEYIYSLIKKSL